MIAMNDLSPAERVLSGGRSDLAAYRERIVASTARRHGPALEAVLLVACNKFKALNDAYVAYLKGNGKGPGGSPGGQNRSRRWGEADHAYTGALEAVSAAFGVQYPKPDGTLPITEVEALIEHRVGPLCTGWTVNDQLVHHPEDQCPVHPADA